MGPEEHGGHCELEYNGLEIPDENRLGEVGQGLKIVQIRLGACAFNALYEMDWPF